MDGKKVATFRERFVELVDSSPKSQTVIAQEFGVAKQTISAWYNGKSSPKLPSASSLADYFGVSLSWLLGFDVDKNVNKDLQRNYDNFVNNTLDRMDNVGILFPEESELILSYRSLSPRGQDLLLVRAEELKLLYGKKPEDTPAESV